MADYRAEPVHVGRRIAAHREELGVTLDEMKRQVSVPKVHSLLRAERAERPQVYDIEVHHQAMIACWVESETAPAMQLARREQWYATGFDADLWNMAKIISPSVTWWWGVKSADGVRGAWCHLCSILIHSYDVGRGVTRPVRLSVMHHRFEHYDKLDETTIVVDTEHTA